MKIPTWLYWPMKAMVLTGFGMPFVLWAMQWNSVARDAETAVAARVANGIKTVEKQGAAFLAPAQSAPIDQGTTTPADSAYLRGIDVSHYQGSVNWDQVAKAGVVFAFAKATGGNSFVDPHFANNWYGMREANLYRGAYHFFLADDDPIEQAKHYANTLGKLRSNDLPPMLDVEQDDNTDIKTLQERALVWLQEVEKSTGRRPILYTDNGFADTILTDSRFSSYPLWIADYAEKVGAVPSPWEMQSWQFWQYEDTGTIAGIEGDVDLDRFKGTVVELLSFIEKSHVK